MEAAALSPARVRTRPVAIGVAVFVCGGVLLGVEIASSRVLAPFFGNSLYVWGAVIGVVLAGLAVGYVAGGALADRAPTPFALLAVIAAGSVGVFLIPVLDEPVLELVVRWDPGPRLDPVLAMVLLFGAPSVLLAAVTPIAVRLSAPALAVLGRRAGLLFSISTFGSIAGTFLAAFWLVPAVGVDQLLGLMAAALLAAAGVVALAERVWIALAIALVASGGAVAGSFAVAPKVGVAVTGAAARNWSPIFRLRGAPAGTERASYDGTVVFRKDTQYHRLAVVDAYDGTRQLRFDSSYQSAEQIDHPYATVFPYTDYFQLGLAYNPAARHVLMIGLGGGSTVKSLLRDDPALDVDVAELDPVVRQVARRYFSVPPDGPRLHTTIEDGRRYLATTKRRWDVIMIDAYYSDSIPFHLVTLEFLELVRSHLAQDGVVVANVVGSERGKGSELFRSMFRTYRSAFPSVVVHPVLKYDGDSGDGLRNLMVVASRTAAPSKRELLERWARHRARQTASPDLEVAIRGRRSAVSSTGVPVLTDDYAPTDALIVGGF